MTDGKKLPATDVLVVGGGIVGCATAYYLAREGVEVTLIDKGEINGEGSGANAGSLHLLMVSRFFKARDPLWMAGSETLMPFLRQGVAVWRELAGTLDRDIELHVGGGLMVAETAGQLRILEEKAAMERRLGIDARVVRGDEMRSIAPYLSPRIAGATFCADEGKVNPILATPALVHGAEQGGARILRQTTLLGLRPTGHGFEARTSRGTVRCAKVVNGAGGAADRVGAMAGVPVPIERHARHMNVTEAAEPLIEHLVQHADRLLSLKQAGVGNVIIGGGWPAVIDPATGHPQVLGPSIMGSLGVAQGVVPAIGALRLIRTWAGVIAFTPDGGGILGAVPGIGGYYMGVPPNAGYTGGPLCGRLLAEVITGRRPTIDMGPLSITRFATMPAACGK